MTLGPTASLSASRGAEVDVRGDDSASRIRDCCQHHVVWCAPQVEIGDVAGLGEELGELVLEGLVHEEPHAEAGSGSTAWSTAAAANISDSRMSGVS